VHRNETASIQLPAQRLILASGPDAQVFLQGQLSSDLRALAPERPQWSSYNSPKGRMLAVLRLFALEDAIALRLHESVAETVLARLRKFVLRSKVTLDLAAAAPAGAGGDWRREDLLAGVPLVYPVTSEHFVPQMCNLDRLGGVSFDKGCYTGQEIVARLHFLGTLKRRMFLCRSAAAPGGPGTPVYEAGGDGQAVGEIVDSLALDSGYGASVVLQLSHAQSTRLHAGAPGGVAFAAPLEYSYAS
jgi:folate-binding protein YgfZ